MLQLFAVCILKKYNPKILVIAGSAGKTFIKEAISVVLNKKFRVKRGEKKYNDEIGIPLTIIGAESGGESLILWLKVFFKGFFLLLLPAEYPEILILEIGADRPRDMKYLTNFIRVDVGIITEISTSQVEFFKTLDEKSLAILNIDNEYAAKIKNQLKARIVTLGFSEQAEMKSTDVSYNYYGEEVRGLSFKLNYKGSSVPVRLNNVLAEDQIYSALAAAAVGVELGLNLVEISEVLGTLPPIARLE